VLREVYTETTGRRRISFTDEQRRPLAIKGKALTPEERKRCSQIVRPARSWHGFANWLQRSMTVRRNARSPAGLASPMMSVSLSSSSAGEPRLGLHENPRCSSRTSDRVRSHDGGEHPDRYREFATSEAELQLNDLAPLNEVIPNFAKVGQRVGHPVGQVEKRVGTGNLRTAIYLTICTGNDLNFHASQHRNLKPAGRCGKLQVAGITCTKVQEDAGNCRNAHSGVPGWARSECTSEPASYQTRAEP